MKVTVDVGPYLLEEAKNVAAESGRSLDEVISDALCAALNRRRLRKQNPQKVTLPTFGGGGVRPGIDLNNSAALLELMESERDAQIRERCSPKRRR